MHVKPDTQAFRHILDDNRAIDKLEYSGKGLSCLDSLVNTSTDIYWLGASRYITAYIRGKRIQQSHVAEPRYWYEESTVRGPSGLV